MYKCVVFDLDGTLLNTLDDLANAGNYALVQQQLPIHKNDEYRRFVGNGIPKLIERILPAGSTPEKIARTKAIFSDYYELHKFDFTKPYEGITELISLLAENGVKTGVVTNKAHDFAVEIIRNYFGDSIDLIYGQRDGFPKKPDPTSLLKMIDEFGLSRSEALYIGDSDVDVLTAKNAGVSCCGALWGFRGYDELKRAGADFLVDSADAVGKIVFGR